MFVTRFYNGNSLLDLYCHHPFYANQHEVNLSMAVQRKNRLAARISRFPSGKTFARCRLERLNFGFNVDMAVFESGLYGPGA